VRKGHGCVDVRERCRLPELSTCGDPHQMLACISYFVTTFNLIFKTLIFNYPNNLAVYQNMVVDITIFLILSLLMQKNCLGRKSGANDIYMPLQLMIYSLFTEFWGIIA
jgi:uncharacterized protein (DUF983 family)